MIFPRTQKRDPNFYLCPSVVIHRSYDGRKRTEKKKENTALKQIPERKPYGVFIWALKTRSMVLSINKSSWCVPLFSLACKTMVENKKNRSSAFWFIEILIIINWIRPVRIKVSFKFNFWLYRPNYNCFAMSFVNRNIIIIHLLSTRHLKGYFIKTLKT